MTDGRIAFSASCDAPEPQILRSGVGGRYFPKGHHSPSDLPPLRGVSALGQKRTCAAYSLMSALGQKRTLETYSINSSARPMSVFGTLIPSAFAVLRLMISSTFVAI